MKSQLYAPQSGIYCSVCGHFNPSWRSECEKCRSQLISSNRPAYSNFHDRPGCVTVYAGLLGILAGLVAIGGVIAGTSMLGDSSSSPLGLSLIVGVCAIAGSYFLLARGLWRLRNWARIIVIVLQSLGVIGNLLSVLLALGTTTNAPYGYGPDLAWSSTGALVGLVIGGYTLYWFASHGEYFS